MKEKILEAVYELTKSPEGLQLTTAKIAKAAGVAEGTLYNYFSNKQDLIESLFRHVNAKYLSQLREYLRPHRTLDSIIHHLFEYHADYFSEASNMFRFMFGPQAAQIRTPRNLPLVFVNYKKLIRELLDQHVDEIAADIGTDYLATFMLGVLNALVIRSSAFPGTLDVKRGIAYAESMFKSFIFVKKS